MLKDRKERTQDYVKSRLSESHGPDNSKKDLKQKKKQIKLPSTDLLYLNHEFEDREDFERIEQNPMAIIDQQDPVQKSTFKKRQISFPVSYDHVQSTLNSKHSASDLNSGHTKSQTSMELVHDTSALHGASSLSLLSKDDLVRTNKAQRRKEIEAKFKNPLERDFMEMMESDIERLSECFAIESGQDLDIPPEGNSSTHNKSSTYLLDEQVRKMQTTFGKDYQNHINSFLEEKLQGDVDRLGEEIPFRRERSPAGRNYYRGRTNSPDRNSSSQNQRVVKAHAQRQSSPSNPGKFSTQQPQPPEVNHKNGFESGRRKDGSLGVKHKVTKATSLQQPLSSEKRIDPLEAKNRTQKVPATVLNQKENLYHAQRQPTPLHESESLGNKTKNSGFLRNNKYTEGQNNAIYEESSDNPFDKFEKIARANQVAYF